MFGTGFWSSGRIVHALNPGPFIQPQLSELLFSNRTPCLFHIKTKQNKQPVLILFSLIQGSLVLPSCQALTWAWDPARPMVHKEKSALWSLWTYLYVWTGKRKKKFDPHSHCWITELTVPGVFVSVLVMKMRSPIKVLVLLSWGSCDLKLWDVICHS